MGLGAQLALPILVSSGMVLVGETGVGGGVVVTIRVVDDVEVDDVDLVDDLGRLDEDADGVVPGVSRT